MNMFGWTTWGGFDPGDANENYREIGPMQLFKHHTGLVVAVPKSVDREDAFLALAQMNEHLDDLTETARIRAGWPDA